MKKSVSMLFALMLTVSGVAIANDTLGVPTMVSMPPEDSKEMPANVEKITHLLSARHPEDVPGPKTWAAHPDADDALKWIATHGPLNFHRERALSILRHYPDPSTKDFLLAFLQEDRYHPLIRAGAARGLTGQTVGEADCTEVRSVDAGSSELVADAVKRLIRERCS